MTHTKASIEALKFSNALAIMMNIDKDVLEKIGVLTPGAVGGNDWSRWNKEPLIFVRKLDDRRLQALWEHIESRQTRKMPDDISHRLDYRELQMKNDVLKSLNGDLRERLATARNRISELEVPDVPPVRKAEHLPVPDGYGWLLECEGRYGLGENQLYNIRSVIDGNMVKLSSCFEWSKEKHGHEYWFERNVGRVPLSDTDKQFLRYLLREYREAA